MVTLSAGGTRRVSVTAIGRVPSPSTRNVRAGSGLTIVTSKAPRSPVRSIGPGIIGAPPSAAKAQTAAPGSLGVSGYHIARTGSRRTRTVSPARLPEASVLSWLVATGRGGGGGRRHGGSG